MAALERLIVAHKCTHITQRRKENKVKKNNNKNIKVCCASKHVDGASRKQNRFRVPHCCRAKKPHDDPEGYISGLHFFGLKNVVMSRHKQYTSQKYRYLEHLLKYRNIVFVLANTSFVWIAECVNTLHM